MQRKNGQFARKGSGEPKQDDNPPEETWYALEYEQESCFFLEE